MMNSMKYYLGGIFASLFLVFSIFTLFSITEVNAEEGISVNPTGYENTIIVEFENNSDSKIKTVRMWAGGEITFESFKSEPGWGGGKYSDGKLIIFTATNTLNPSDSVKFGLVTSEKIDGINWKVLDQNGNDIDSEESYLLKISDTDAYDNDHFINYTQQPLLKVLSWRTLIYWKVFRKHAKKNLKISLSKLELIQSLIIISINQILKLKLLMCLKRKVL